MSIAEIGFYFCLRFRRHFFRHTSFLGFKILKKICFFFLIQILAIIGKCIGCCLAYPFLGEFFFIKSAKRMCICDYVKNRIGTF